MAVSAQQAACNAMAAYLSAKMPGVKVRPRWAEASAAITPPSITVIMAGEVEHDTCGHVVVNQVNVDATKANYTWQVLHCRLPLQLDVWAASDVARDNLASQLDFHVNRGTSQLTGLTNQDPFDDGVALNLLAGDGYTGIATFLFEASRPFDTGDAVQRCEYRATARGQAEYMLVQTAQSPRLAQISLKARVYDRQPPAPGALYDITSLLNSGAVIHTTGP